MKLSLTVNELFEKFASFCIFSFLSVNRTGLNSIDVCRAIFPIHNSNMASFII